MKDFKPGIYPDLDIELYHSSAGISSTGIKEILDCPARYYHECIIKRQEKTAADMRNEASYFKVGRALHTRLLEPHKFDENFQLFIPPDYYDKITKEIRPAAPSANVYKEKYNDMLIAGITPLEEKNYNNIIGMAEALAQHPVWDRIKYDGVRECSFFWNAGLYNTPLRARPDIYNDKFVIDIKTANSILSFPKIVIEKGYHRQAAMQLDCLEKFTGKKRYFGFLVVETRPPYLTKAFTLSQLFLDLGRREYLDGAALYSECLMYNNWPGYDETFDLIEAPKWAVEARL